MSTVNGRSLIEAGPIANMLEVKERLHGVSHGLTEAGYDIRLKQAIKFSRSVGGRPMVEVDDAYGQAVHTARGRFVIASAMERFTMPDDLVGVVHDKSTWARQGVSVFNTVIEPGWQGFLTLEIVFHSETEVIIPAGAGIAQVLFSRVENHAKYAGKYQDQADEPVSAILESSS